MQKFADLGGPEFFFIVNFQVSFFQLVIFNTNNYDHQNNKSIT